MTPTTAARPTTEVHIPHAATDIAPELVSVGEGASVVWFPVWLVPLVGVEIVTHVACPVLLLVTHYKEIVSTETTIHNIWWKLTYCKARRTTRPRILLSASRWATGKVVLGHKGGKSARSIRSWRASCKSSLSRLSGHVRNGKKWCCKQGYHLRTNWRSWRDHRVGFETEGSWGVLKDCKMITSLSTQGRAGWDFRLVVLRRVEGWRTEGEGRQW